jgi:hypothetical protein
MGKFKIAILGGGRSPVRDNLFVENIMIMTPELRRSDLFVAESRIQQLIMK